jgi:enoyl-CoA hydratase/carnithine racemase
VTFQTLLFDKRDAVAWVTLNRPEVLNAFNVRMRDELYEVLTAIRDDDEVRAVVLRGAGRAFCAGADLTEFGTAPSPTQARSIRFARDVWALLYDLPAPTLASLHGFVFGSGLEMSLFCDLRLAAASTQFAMPEVRLGLIPAAGGTQMLPRVCGLSRATELLLTGRRFDAAEALRYGIASRVVPDDQLAGETETLAHDLAGLSPAAAAAAREAVRAALDLPLHEGLRAETRLAETLRRAGNRE